MRVVSLRLRTEVYGDTVATITLLTSKTNKELKEFTNNVFDILSNIDMHGYRGTTQDPYRVAMYVKSN